MNRSQSVWKPLPRGGLVVGLLLGALCARAQGVSLERLELNPGAAGSLLVGTGELLPQGEWRVSTVGQYQQDPLVVSQNNVDQSSIRVGSLVSSRMTAHVAAAYSLSNWLELGAQFPLVAFQRGDDLSDKGFARPARYGLSTPSLGLRWGVLSQRNGRWADVALGLGAGLPFGSASGLGGDTRAYFIPQVMVGRRFGGFRLAWEARLQVPGPAVAPEASLNREVRLGVVAATVGRRLRWELDLAGFIPLGKDIRPSMNLLVGSRYLATPSLELFALGGLGMGSAPGTPLFRVMVGTAFGHVTPQRLPGESSVNCSPGLAHTAEECPEMDEDHDGVLNGVDKCALDFGVLERQGCPKRDRDGDNIEDALDECPDEKGEQGWNGCPMPDEDRDGVEDKLDLCPDIPGDRLADGCLLKDEDKDGIQDDVDECRTIKGKPQFNGCPDTDRDGDGVLNRLDTCPFKPGIEENMGCPRHELPLVELTPTKMKLKSKVYFLTDSSLLDPRSNEQLDWVATVINEHPEFATISIGAHTDNRGFPNANLRLSLERARSVRKYLIERGGVAIERLEAQGYGGTQPIEREDTSTGRENNRRVEFTIIKVE